MVLGDSSEKFALSASVSTEKQSESHVISPEGDIVTIRERHISMYGRDSLGKDIKGFLGSKDVEKPVGEWKRIKCNARGSTITALVNGKLINRAVKVQPSNGRFQVQSEGAEIFSGISFSCYRIRSSILEMYIS